MNGWKPNLKEKNNVSHTLDLSCNQDDTCICFENVDSQSPRERHLARLMGILTDIAQDDQTRQHDETVTAEAQRFYDSAIRADRHGEPVKALLHRNIAYKIQTTATAINPTWATNSGAVTEMSPVIASYKAI